MDSRLHELYFLNQRLSENDYSSVCISSDNSKVERNEILKEFKKGNYLENLEKALGLSGAAVDGIGKALNKAIGGSTTSQHCKGQAMDIDDKYGHATNAEMFEFIKDNLSFDQLIWEFGTKDNPEWVHVSYESTGKQRKQVLRAEKINGKTVYSKW